MYEAIFTGVWTVDSSVNASWLGSTSCKVFYRGAVGFPNCWGNILPSWLGSRVRRSSRDLVRGMAVDTIFYVIGILNLIVGVVFTTNMVIRDLIDYGYVRVNIILALAFNCVMGLPLLVINMYSNLNERSEEG